MDLDAEKVLAAERGVLEKCLLGFVGNRTLQVVQALDLQGSGSSVPGVLSTDGSGAATWAEPAIDAFWVGFDFEGGWGAVFNHSSIGISTSPDASPMNIVHSGVYMMADSG